MDDNGTIFTDRTDHPTTEEFPMIFEPSGESGSQESASESSPFSPSSSNPPADRPASPGKVAFDTDVPTRTVIKVLGVGGGGCNAVQSMIGQGFEGVEFYGINTDHQALQRCKIPNRIQIGENLTQGSGAGALPSIGEQAAREAEDKIREVIDGADMVFITAGLGGGTGTGAAPVIAEIARSMNVLNVAIVTKPFHFEGTQRMRRAEEGAKKLAEHVDTMIAILNDKLMEVVGPKTPLMEGFEVANTVLAQGIRAISDLISTPGLINVDFRDVRTIMGETGGAVMGVGIGKGENRAVEAVRKACHSPLQEKIVIDGARGILINITGPSSITMHEINEATSLIYEMADPEANVIFGVVIDDKMNDAMRVTIIATGFGDEDEGEKAFRAPEREKLRPRTNPLINPPTVEPATETPVGAATAEKSEDEANPEPAILRKRKAQPSTDFGSEDNPMRDWDRDTPVTEDKDDEPLPSPGAASASASESPGAAPAAPSSEASERRTPTGFVTNPFGRKTDEPRKPAGPVMSDSEPKEEEAPGPNDPYFETPALHRRRRQRFFE